MKTFGDRLKKARQAAGLSQSELARRVGVRPQTIQFIEAGGVKKPRYTVEIALQLKVNPEWLANGRGSMRNSGFTLSQRPAHYLSPPLNDETTILPLIDWHQAGAWAERLSQQVYPSDEKSVYAEWFACPIPCSERGFVLRNKALETAGRFSPGDLLFVDPDIAPSEGKFVIVRMPTDAEACIKQVYDDHTKRMLREPVVQGEAGLVELSDRISLCGVIIFRGEIV